MFIMAEAATGPKQTLSEEVRRNLQDNAGQAIKVVQPHTRLAKRPVSTAGVSCSPLQANES